MSAALTGVILQARCVGAVRRAVRRVWRTPRTASAVKNLSSYTSASVWTSVLQRTPCGTGSASTARQPVRSAAHSGRAQVPTHSADTSCRSLSCLIQNVVLGLYSSLHIVLLWPVSVAFDIFSLTSDMSVGERHFDPNWNTSTWGHSQYPTVTWQTFSSDITLRASSA